MKIIIFQLVCFFLLSCSGHEPQNSKVQGASDIASTTLRPDGNYDVVCKNGGKEVRSAMEIRDGRVCDSTSNGPFMCVSHNGNGFGPWDIARISDEGQVTIIPGSYFFNLNGCQNAITKARTLGQFTLMCLSTNGDDTTP
jgi:hypothetical protein